MFFCSGDGDEAAASLLFHLWAVISLLDAVEGRDVVFGHAHHVHVVCLSPLGRVNRREAHRIVWWRIIHMRSSEVASGFLPETTKVFEETP